MTNATSIPTLHDVLDAVDQRESGTRQRDLKSAVATFCRAVGKQPAEIFALPKEVRLLRETVSPLALGISERRWANVCSGVTKALALVRNLMPSRNTAPIHPDWKALLDLLPANLSRRLSAAARWLSSKNVLPVTMAVEHLQAYQDAIINDRMRRNAEQAADEFIWTWQRAAKALPEWPQVILERPSKRDTYSYPLETFPASFTTDVEAYIERLIRGALLDVDNDDDEDFGPLKPVRPATAKTRRHQLRMAASCLAHSGVDPASITSIAVLVEVPNAKKILNFLMERRGGQATSGVAQMAIFLAKLALHWVEVDPAHHAKLKRLAQRVAVQDTGMTSKNRERLRPFDNDDVVAEFVGLPDTIRKHVEHSKMPIKRKAVLAQMAAAIALQLVIPLRKSNLAAIDLFGHMVANRNGVYLVIPEAETKNGAEVNFQIPGFALDVIKWYIREHRPHLLQGESTALFPGRNGGCKSAHTLGLQISETVRKFTGLPFHPHLFRHLAGKIFLDANPGNYEVVRQLLRHKRIDTTTGAYSGAETRRAALMHADLIESLRQAHRPAKRRKRA